VVVDVRIAFDANANAGSVSAGMTDVVKDGLRAGGDTVICYHLEKTSQPRYEIPTPATTCRSRLEVGSKVMS